MIEVVNVVPSSLSMPTEANDSDGVEVVGALRAVVSMDPRDLQDHQPQQELIERTVVSGGAHCDVARDDGGSCADTEQNVRSTTTTIESPTAGPPMAAERTVISSNKVDQKTTETIDSASRDSRRMSPKSSPTTPHRTLPLQTILRASLHRPDPNLLHADDSMTSSDSLDVMPYGSNVITGVECSTIVATPSSLELPEGLHSACSTTTPDHKQATGASSESCTSRSHDPLNLPHEFPQTILTSSPRARQSPKLNGTLVPQPKQKQPILHDRIDNNPSVQYQQRRAIFNGEHNLKHHPSVPQSPHPLDSIDDSNIRGMSSYNPESSDPSCQSLAFTQASHKESTDVTPRSELSVIGDDRVPLCKSELQRRSTIKQSNVTSPYGPRSLLDDEQSSCSDQRGPSTNATLPQHSNQPPSSSRLAAASDRHRRRLQRQVMTIPLPHLETSTAATAPPTADASSERSKVPSSSQPQQQQQNQHTSKPTNGDTFDEKKDNDETDSQLRAQHSSLHPDLVNADYELRDCLSSTESEVASFDGLPLGVQQRWLTGESPREKMLQSLDGIHAPLFTHSSEQEEPVYQLTPPRVVLGGGSRKGHSHGSKIETNVEDDTTCDGPIFAACFDLNLWGSLSNQTDEPEPKGGTNSKGQWRTASWKPTHDVPLAILDCANIINQEDRCAQFTAHMAPPVQTSLVRVASDFPNPTYAETILPTEVDPRMQDWIASQYAIRERPPRDGSYLLGRSRTVIVHEIIRGNWTWCTAWSPDGAFLAIATENHHLAIVETTSSTVWRVRHDRRIRSPQKNNSTQSIRSVAWGENYIAIGGTGNAVSIVSPVDTYEILLTIPDTGFVGCLEWRGDSNVLAIGSRLDFVMIVRIREIECTGHDAVRLECSILHRIEYKCWVNSISFSPDGSYLAVGDSGGIVSVYDYDESENDAETNSITWFKRKDSILSVEWSPDGKWLYAGGEDRSVTVIDTTYWEIVHRIGQDRWVQCIAASHGGTHVAIGGVSSEISILDVENGWDSVMGIELKGLVPLSAKWHPRDQYLVMTGQDNNVLAVETTNARHVKGHHLHSISPIRAIEFSPDGRMAIVGNESGVVTFYSLSGTSFITSYEMVVPFSSSICVQWSLNGMFIVIGSQSNLVVVGRKRNKRQGKKNPPNASGFSIRKMIPEVRQTHAVSIDFQSNYIAVSGSVTRILDVKADFATVQEWKKGPYYTNAWSPDGRWLAMMGKEKYLRIYDTSSNSADRWKAIFSMKCDFVGRALAWGPLIGMGGLLYLAYGGDSNAIYIMEIRTKEGTWETVLNVPRDASINALDWSTEGLLAAGIGNGTVSIVDLAYLQSGVAVNEMDYNWQRQALTCFTEIRRNRGDNNSIKTLRWIPAASGSDILLAVGGTDGEVEIIDLTERRRCKGYAR